MLTIALAAALTCFSPTVHDGDTIRCDGARVRIWGIDAPELDRSPRCRTGGAWACDPAAMRYAIPARDRMIELTHGRTVTCEQMDVDRYRRIVARCTAGGLDVGQVLVREGLARDYTRYSRGRYLADETRARRARDGMWSDTR